MNKVVLFVLVALVLGVAAVTASAVAAAGYYVLYLATRERLAAPDLATEAEADG